MLTPEQLEHYVAHGYCVVPSLLTDAEATHSARRLAPTCDVRQRAGQMIEKGGKAGNTTLLKMWYEAADDLYGYIARDRRLVDVAAQIIGKDTYLYSHKMTMKEPQQGGAWEWHQDYGYWYQNKCLAPEMLSIWIALDPSVRANGCLQVLPDSHQARPTRPPPGERADGRGRGVPHGRARPVRAGVRRDGARGRARLRLQPAAPLRREHQRPAPLGILSRRTTRWRTSRSVRSATRRSASSWCRCPRVPSWIWRGACGCPWVLPSRGPGRPCRDRIRESRRP